MTRFARAKGSKASNERLPEDATSWIEMKKQLEQVKQEAEFEKNRQKIDAEREENYQKFLKESEDKGETSWADFPTVSITSKVNKLKKTEGDTEKKSKKKKLVENEVDEVGGGKKIKKKKESVEAEEDKVMKADEDSEKKSKKKKLVENEVDEDGEGKKIKKKKKYVKSDEDGEGEDGNDIVKEAKNKKKRKGGEEEVVENNMENDESEGISKKKKKKNKLDENTISQNSDLVSQEKLVDNENKPIITSSGKKRKIEKKKAKKMLELMKKKPIEEMNAQELELYNKKKAKKERQVEKRKMFKKQKKEAENRYRELNNIYPNAPVNDNQNNNKRKNNGPDKEHKRRKPNSQVKSININGKNEEIAYFDGFPIKKEEAERLNQLKKQMISRGLPKSQVNMALKLERRKAEKALAREKKTTCFNCRQSGHNLSECPNINNANSIQTAASGICYKCGSTEHTQFQCKVVKNPEFKFATCFICNEQGHLSRQCPDNARGMYPKGGACKLCGDVTHLRKDCPTHVANQEANNISLNRMNYSNIEGLDDEIKLAKPEIKRVNKKIKFE